MTPIIEYALSGLDRCYMAERGCWSYTYHLDGRKNPNQSYPVGDHFYSLNVILGLATAGKEVWVGSYDLPALLQKNIRALITLPVPPYAYGMALWAAAELGERLEENAGRHIYSFITNKQNWANFTAQDVGMILSGICAQRKSGNREYDAMARDLFLLIGNHFHMPSMLFRHASKGLRKNFSSFASQAYIIAALYHYGESYRSEEALQMADAGTRKMLSLQGVNGEWAWFYNVKRPLVMDYYEIYSVHQYGMAPLFLAPAEKRGVEGARMGILKGFGWLFANNDLQQDMLVPELGMFYRSIARKGEIKSKYKRILRSMVNTLLARHDQLAPASALAVNPECRSYELGWLLYAFGNRTDMPEITHHRMFASLQTSQRMPSISSSI